MRGWRMLIVNEADCLTPNAAYVWLAALESLPPRTVVVFTTNHSAKLPARLRDRCETLEFQAGALLLMPACQELANKVWLAETGRTDTPDVHDLGIVDERGNVSFRRLLQALAMRLRVPGSAKADASAAPIKTPAPEEKSADPTVECDWQVMGRRYLAGESSHRLARECGLPETTLRGRLNRMGFRRKAVAA